MTNDSQSAEAYAELERRIDTIESGYEFLLAYAAQGRHTDRGASPERNVRNYLERMDSALADFGAAAMACAAQRDAALADSSGAFFEAVERDARVARGAVRLVLAQADIGSQIVDNLNASIHLRALLTDIFILDEALKPRAGEKP